jgi:hypothetical protein
MKPAILKDHLNPIDGLLRRWLMSIGQITPPIEDPEYTIPIVTARFRLNQWLIHATDGKKLQSEGVKWRDIHQRNRDTERDSLCEEELPVIRTLWNYKETRYEESRSSKKKPSGSIRIEYPSREKSAREHTKYLVSSQSRRKYLKRTKPRNIRRGTIHKLMRRVIRLEDTK